MITDNLGSRQMNDKVVYTVLTGGYEMLRAPEAESAGGWDFVCLADETPAETDVPWQRRLVPWQSPDSARLSRFPKLNPHIVLPEYKQSLYVDANVRVTDGLLKRADEAVARGAICAMCRHPDCDCVYREALRALRLTHCEPGKVIAQMRFLMGRNYPEHAGLFQCNIILREHKHPQAVKFSEAWWDMFSRFSRRDQLSVGWALRESSLVPAEFLPPAAVAALLSPHPSKPMTFKRAAHFLRRMFYRARLRRLYKKHGITS